MGQISPLESCCPYRSNLRHRGQRSYAVQEPKSVASEDFPKTLVEFDERFGIEEACQVYLAGLRRPEGFRCPACG
jgi:hypothetical protein